MRARRGTSLLEVLVASTVLLYGLLGVSILIQQTSRATGQADFNQLAAKEAQEILTGAVSTGFNNLLPLLGTTTVCDGAFTNGQTYACTVQYIDTSPPGVLPNLGQPSVLVRVIIQRNNLVAMLGGRRFIVENYVLPLT